MIDNHRAVLFGGGQADRYSKETYVLDMAKMVKYNYYILSGYNYKWLQVDV